MSSFEAIEIGMVEYARQHGLATNHLAEPPIDQLEAIQRLIPDALTDDTNMPRIDIPIYIHKEEHLTVDKGAARLLQDANNGQLSTQDVTSVMLSLLDIRRAKYLRLEIPLLTTDHASDFKAFARWEESHQRDGCLPMEPLDDELDVGLEWPQKLRSLPAKILKELQDEKIEIQKDTLLYLQSIVKSSWTEEDKRRAWESATTYKRNTALGPVTPPLFPMSSPQMPYIPSSPDSHLPLLSDPASLVSEDARAAEHAIFSKDVLVPPTECNDPMSDSSITLGSYTHMKTSDFLSPISSIDDNEHILIHKRVKTEDHKIEVPLIPMLVNPPSKIVTFREVVEEMLLDSICKPDEEKVLVDDSEEATETFFQEAFGEAADEAYRAIEQEQLQEADAKGRVEVPIMDFSLPEPPWKHLQDLSNSGELITFQKSMIGEILEEFGRLSVWPGISKLEPRLRWTVFPSELGRVVLDESFGDEDILQSFLMPSSEDPIVDSSRMIWKQPGLRILKDDGDSDECDLDFACFETDQSKDVDTLVKQRKRQYTEEISMEAGLGEASLAGSVGRDILTNPRITEFQKVEAMMRGQSPARTATKLDSDRRKEMSLAGSFYTASALDNFLEIRAAKRHKPIESSYFARSPVKDASILPSPGRLQERVSTEGSHLARRLLPVPSIIPPLMPTPFIISSAVLRRRGLTRHLITLFPSAVLIERDFTAHNTTAWIANSITRSPIASDLASEADIIISPSTGIILTTLQKIKQKPLPGQKSKSAFKERLERVCPKYERLILFVSEGCPDDSTNGLAESDALALAEVTGFCGSLDVTVIVQFIAGGETTLAKWLVTFMVHYGLQGDAIIPLLEEETLWELFLRRAGMNAFAAQGIIAQLKAPDGVDVESGSKAGLFGITAFVEMGQEERRRRFGGLLGGHRVLDRTGSVLDSNWS